MRPVLYCNVFSVPLGWLVGWLQGVGYGVYFTGIAWYRQNFFVKNGSLPPSEGLRELAPRRLLFRARAWKVKTHRGEVGEEKSRRPSDMKDLKEESSFNGRSTPNPAKTKQN